MTKPYSSMIYVLQQALATSKKELRQARRELTYWSKQPNGVKLVRWRREFINRCMSNIVHLNRAISGLSGIRL